MRATYGRENVWWITCASAWSCLHFKSKDDGNLGGFDYHSIICHIWRYCVKLLLRRLLSSKTDLSTSFIKWKKDAEAHKVTITKRDSPGLYKDFWLGSGKIYNPEREREKICLFVSELIWVYIWSQLDSEAISGWHSRSQVGINVTQYWNTVKVIPFRVYRWSPIRGGLT